MVHAHGLSSPHSAAARGRAWPSLPGVLLPLRLPPYARVRAAGGGPQGGGGAAPPPPPAAPPPASSPTRRLFSNLNPATLRHAPGTVWGAASLVAGTTVGAGILALPAVTAGAGFLPSAAALTGCWAYAVVTGLLIAEVSVNTMCELGSGSGVSLGSMARRTLGDFGARAVSATYVALHFSLLVAYIAKAGQTISGATGLPLPAADAAFVAAFGGLCFLAGPGPALDTVNTTLVGLVLASFLGLLAVAGSGVDAATLLAPGDWGALPDALPVVALSFVYQNVVPVICSSLEGDVARVRQAILLGVAVPYAMFMAWEAAILGSAGALAGGGGGLAAGGDPLAALQAGGSPAVGALIAGFTLLAISTSYIGFVLGLSDFIADGLQLPSGGGGPQQRAAPYALTLLPPLGLALAFPDLFFSALDFAGTYGVLVLFGLIPPAMAWSERYGGTTLARQEAMPGGKPMLVAVAAAAAAVIADQLREALLG